MKYGQGGRQNNSEGSACNSLPSRGGGGGLRACSPIKLLNLYPQRCIFRLICGSQMTMR